MSLLFAHALLFLFLDLVSYTDASNTGYSRGFCEMKGRDKN
jgi:hypothetical protein